MIFLRSLPLLVMLFSGKVLAYEFPIEVFEYVDGEKVVAFINERDIDKSLHWVPFEGSPPLTLVDALKGIRKYMVSDPDLVDAALTEIELKRIPHHEKHWHYLVKMKSEADGKSRSHYFVVLMNGKIILAMVEPEPLK